MPTFVNYKTHSAMSENIRRGMEKMCQNAYEQGRKDATWPKPDLDKMEWAAIREILLDHRDRYNVGPGGYIWRVNNTLGEPFNIDVDSIIARIIHVEPVL